MTQPRRTLDDAMPGRQIYARWVICGNLRLETAMHLGGEATERVDMPIFRDPRDGAPLLPGTTLAGALRNALADRLAGYGAEEPGAVSALFGGGRGVEDGNQSPTIVFDALGRLPEGQGTEIRDGVAISATSGTAEDHKKYDYEVIPAGTIFPVRLDLVVPEGDTEEGLVKSLAAAIDALTSGGTAFGAKRSRGLGRVSATWAARRFDLTSAEGWVDWVTSDHETPLGAVEGRTSAIEVLQAQCPAELGRLQPPADARRHVLVDLYLELVEDLLIRSPGSSPDAPDVSHLRSAGAPIVPGTSLAGVLRAHALRVARLVRHRQDDGERWVDRLFGPRFQGQRPPPDFEFFASRLRVGEAVIHGGRSRRQARVAIDRFTQGTIPTALFDEQVQEGGRVRVRLELRNPRPGELGLLLLVIKDLLSGDLPVGGASAVGRGVVTGSATLTFHDGAKTAPCSVSLAPHESPTGEAAAKMIDAAIRQFHEAPKLHEDAQRVVDDDGGVA